jgi:transposase-like protein
MLSLKSEEVKLEAIKQREEGKSIVEISSSLGIPASTLGDFLNATTHKVWWDVYRSSNGVVSVSDNPPNGNALKAPEKNYEAPVRIETSKYAKPYSSHAVIPDLQVKDGIDLDYCRWYGEYCAEKRPDVIINIGDWFDLPSLCSYDKGTRKAEGKRLYKDIASGIKGMNAFLRPIEKAQMQDLVDYGEIRWKPVMKFTLGNHEQRLERHLNACPELHGFVSYKDFQLEENGWEVYDFLEPCVVNGVMYIHYMPNPMTGKPYGGAASTVLKNVGCSFTMGHCQKLDIDNRTLPNGQKQWSIVNGAGYPHDEGYKGYTGNKHWRGMIYKYEVHEGDYDFTTVNLNYLERRFGGK